MSTEAYDAAENSERSYDLAIKAARERQIRSGQLQPRIGDAQEQRWAKEGPRKFAALETVVTPLCPQCGSYRLGLSEDPCTECGAFE